MKKIYIFPVVILTALSLGGYYVANAAADHFAVSAPQPTIPPNIANDPSKPMFMLASSKDHTLFYPAYSDFEDIDGDGRIDTTFKPNFKYYGYFDSSKCYSYGNGYFEPVNMATKSDDGRFVCSHSESLWSGNFMNWALMSRVDVIRKMLYGGKRFLDGYQDGADGVSQTILERVNVSRDAHSYVKHYAGQDIRDYTPFSPADLTKSWGSNVNVYSGLTICNRSSVMGPNGTPQIRLVKGNYSMWGTVDGTVCQWSSEGAGDFGSKLTRFFLDSDKGNGQVSHETNFPSLTIDGAAYGGNSPELIARVKVCVPGLIGEERCQPFPIDSTKNLKPYGIFQEFGIGNAVSNAARAEFGVITGSYDLNLTAGALRKNIGDFLDEINVETGVFCHSSTSACPNTLGDGRVTGNGAIKSFDSFILFGRGGSDYAGSNQQLPNTMQNGELVAWGNPVGEMVVQALNYFAGKPSSNPTNNTNDNQAGLPVVTWRDPLITRDRNRVAMYGEPICRPMYTLALSSSALSFDADSGVMFANLPNKRYPDLNSYVDVIGENEGINKTRRSVGSADGANTFGETCASKYIEKLSDVSGICPEAPAIGGTYQVAGASLYANTSKIRDLNAFTSLPNDLDRVKDVLKVKTLAASLAGGVPRVEVAIPNQPGKYVYITPESLWNANGKRMPGGILTFKAINSGDLINSAGAVEGSYGSFVVTWNDSLFGGDYDMDITGFLRYDVRSNSSDPSKYNLTVSTDILKVGAGYLGTHGFSIIGTDKDGRYLTHQHTTSYGIAPIAAAEGYMCGGTSSTEPRCNVSSNWQTIRDRDSVHSISFEMVGVDNVTLHDPLWYAAKYGYFNSSVENSDGTFSDILLPPDQASWDNLSADGSFGSDGVPDGYFLARRPDILEEQLRKALSSIASVSNAASAISATALVEGAYKYDVSFDSTAITGSLKAFQIQGNGDFSNTATWEAGAVLQAKLASDADAKREIITNYRNSAFPFHWDNLNADYQMQLTVSGTNRLSVDHAKIAIDYIRGDQTHESATGLRQRGSTLLGPIVNSTPWVQQRPLASWGDDATGYADFYTSNRNRKKLLWIGANDGMLHAFDAENGSEVFAYVPGAIANRLAEIPLQRSSRTKLNDQDFITGLQTTPTGTVWPYVDGNPYTADVKIDSNWRTYLFGSLGRGGRGIFALDVTTTNNLTEERANNIFKWQFTAEDDQDLGYQTADVKIHLSSNQASNIARMNNGKFAVIIGNGQKSITGKAALFIIFVDGPSSTGSWEGRYKKIVVDSGTGNGITAVRWEDINGDGTADVVYAGDLKGNLWKFDIASEDVSKWKPAFSAEAGIGASGASQLSIPLFQASVIRNNQVVPLPITTAPEVLYMAAGGVLVNFATGNAFSQADFSSSTQTQRVYGVWDKGAAMSNPVLQERVYRRLSNGVVVVQQGAEMDWSQYAGWFFNLPGSGEAVLADPSYDAGVLSFVSTRLRSGGNECNTMPANSLFTIDPIAGLPERVTQSYIDIDGVKVMVAARDISDPKVRMVDNRRAPPKIACQEGEAGCICNGADCLKEAPLCGPGQRSVNAVGKGANATICYSATPRIQWREISGLRTATE